MFDIFNSKNFLTKKYTRNRCLAPLRQIILKCLDSCEIYLKILEHTGKKIVDTKNKVGFLGSIINIHSIKYCTTIWLQRGMIILKYFSVLFEAGEVLLIIRHRDNSRLQ
nr:unnamed protein product [Callosobruchus analis]CAI5857185.1 unnamed protein product [Callosobruchus analis]